MANLSLQRADEADLDFILATERLPGYDEVVGRWDEARHRAALRDDRHAYFVGRLDDVRVGFVIVRDWNSPERVSLIKRVAVSNPGQGVGRSLLRAVVDLVFKNTDAYRLWLGVFPENLRAQAAYKAVGFVGEGVARGSAYFGGHHRDELVMAILRPDWQSG